MFVRICCIRVELVGCLLGVVFWFACVRVRMLGGLLDVFLFCLRVGRYLRRGTYVEWMGMNEPKNIRMNE